MVFERDIPSCSPREVLIRYLRRALIHILQQVQNGIDRGHPQIDGNFPLLLTLHEEPLKPARHRSKIVPISKVNQLSFPAGKKCNRCQFRLDLLQYINHFIHVCKVLRLFISQRRFHA